MTSYLMKKKFTSMEMTVTIKRKCQCFKAGVPIKQITSRIVEGEIIHVPCQSGSAILFHFSR